MLQEMVSLNIDGHQVQMLPSAQQNVLNIDPSQADFIQLSYTSDQFQQQLGSVPTVSSSKTAGLRVDVVAYFHSFLCYLGH